MQRRGLLAGAFIAASVSPGTAYAGPICSGFWDCLPLNLMLLSFQIGMVALPIFLVCTVYWSHARFVSKTPTPRAVRVVYGLSGLLLVYPGLMVFGNAISNWRHDARMIDALRTLPFEAMDYLDVPKGLRVSAYDIEHYFKDLDEVILTARIEGEPVEDEWREYSESDFSDALWAESHQMASIYPFPEMCPGPDFSVGKYFHGFGQGCEEVARTQRGAVVYRAQLNRNQDPDDDYLSAQLGDTLLVFHLGRKMTSTDLDSISRMIDSAAPMTADELLVRRVR